MRLADRTLKGRISDVTLGTLQLTFPIPCNLGNSGDVVWPDGHTTTVEFLTASPKANLTLRLPYPRRSPTHVLEFAEAEAVNNRRKVRIDVSLPVLITDLKGTRPLRQAKTLNVSSGGVLLLCDSALMVSKDYTLQIDLGDEQIDFKSRTIRRVGHNAFAVRFLSDNRAGHALMRKLFARMRSGDPVAQKRSLWNFRKA